MRTFWTAALPVLVSAAFVADTAAADGRGRHEEVFTARLVSYNETPATLSTPARGWFHAKVNEREGKIVYWLWYSEFESNVLQAHLHLGQRHTTGGISVFLCTNLGNGPAGTQPCPQGPATVTGTITRDDVIGPAAQGLAATEFEELVEAIRAGAVYVNVHSANFPAGEIRDQLSR